MTAWKIMSILTRWWSGEAIEDEVLKAMVNVQRYRNSSGKELADLRATYSRREDAITELADEAAHRKDGQRAYWSWLSPLYS